MLRLATRASAVIVTAAGLTLLGAALQSASACEGIGCPSGGTDTSGQTVTVRVTGTFVNPGSPGSPGSHTAAVQVAVPCVFYRGWTGKEYYEGIKNGSITGAGSDEAENGTWEPNPGYEKHKDDTEGRWYFPGCSDVNDEFEDMDDFSAFAENFFDNNPDVFVPPGVEPPVPPVPPEILLAAAEDAMTLPDPVFDRSPQRAGDEATIVNMATWFWQDTETPTTGTVTATAGANSVTVTMDLDGVEYSGEGAGTVGCDDGGVPWTSGGTSDCILEFPRASEGTTVTANANWGGTWTFNGAPQGDVDPIAAEWQTVIPVDEVQSVVTQVD